MKGVLTSFPRKIPKLKEGALPCLFPNVPHYLSERAGTSRRLIDVEQEHFETAIKNSLKTNEDYLQNDSITCLEDIHKIFKKQIVSCDKWALMKCDNKVILCLIMLKDDIPNAIGNITIYENLDFSVFFQKVKITKSPFLKGKSNKLQSFNILEQLVCFLEQLVDKQ